jgi:type I restriction enzyme M protein
LKEFVELQSSFAETEKSWSLSTTELNEAIWDLSVKNPNAEEEAPLREPQVIIEEIIALDKESEAILGKIQELL